MRENQHKKVSVELIVTKLESLFQNNLFWGKLFNTSIIPRVCVRRRRVRCKQETGKSQLGSHHWRYRGLLWYYCSCPWSWTFVSILRIRLVVYNIKLIYSPKLWYIIAYRSRKVRDCWTCSWYYISRAILFSPRYLNSGFSQTKKCDESKRLQNQEEYE